MTTKGIVLAGGIGTRLFPMTDVISKQLLPIYDKPLIYYPIATLMTAGVKDILIITTPQHMELFRNLLGDGRNLGINFSFKIQEEPRGIADAFLVAEEWLGGNSVCLILGDNIFHGSGLGRKLADFTTVDGAMIFGYKVSNPIEYGVVEFDEFGTVKSLEEKPLHPKSQFAIPGLYFYDNTVIEKVKRLVPSDRGELEITSLNKSYLDENKLYIKILPRGVAWLDTGTPSTLFEAASYVRVIEERQGSKIACLEEIAWRMGWISNLELKILSAKYGNSDYGKYLNDILKMELNSNLY